MNRLMEGAKNPWEAEAIHQGGSRNDYGEHRRPGNHKNSDGQRSRWCPFRSDFAQKVA